MVNEDLLEVNNLSKIIDKKQIIEQISFKVKKGEIFGLLGPNGAGKTTIIRTIVKLIKKSGGTIRLNNKDIDQHFEESMKKIGVIVENPDMYPFLTGLQNLKLFAKMSKKAISKKKITQVIEMVGLQNSIQKKVKTYSLGMRQRLGLAQAMLHSPELLILDEPMNGLDPQGMHDLRHLLKSLAGQGVSIIISSHLLAEMDMICDRVAFIQSGKLIKIDRLHSSNDKKSVQKVIFKVDDPLKAKQLILRNHPNLFIQVHDETIELSTDMMLIPLINECLVNGKISVFYITYKDNSLEEKYLNINRKEKVNEDRTFNFQ